MNMLSEYTGNTQNCMHYALSVCIAVMLILITGCDAPEVPDDSDLYIRVVEGNVFDTDPVYGEPTSLRLRRTGFEYKCSECHSDFEHEPTSNRPQGEHADILAKFDHGSTIYCMSCHHTQDRESYVDNLGQAMSAASSETLCARCHGPKYRDWNDGAHGRINGFWDDSFGERNRVTCVQCHDPHTPKFPKMVPSPPPIRSRFETVHKSDAEDKATHDIEEETVHE